MGDYAHTLSAEARREHVEALKRERDGYVARGADDRVRQVDAQLKEFGEAPVGRSERPAATTSTASTRARKRKA